MNIIITIPAYNEEKDIARVIKEIKDVMGDSGDKYKILVVDDGSTDKTVEIARNEGVIVHSNKRNLGLAETFKTEMQKCIELKADIIVHTDADGQYPAKYIPQMVDKIKQGYDLVLGSRFGKGSYSGSFLKNLGNKAFAMMLSKLLGAKISDTTTGFRAFTRDVAELPLINNFTYTQEQLIRVSKAKMKITEIPIQTNKTRKSRLFKGPLNYAVRAWLNIFRIYRDFDPLKFFGIIGGAFLIIGILLGLWITYLVITTGAAGGIPRVILSALSIMVGIQIILFGFLADMFRK